MLCTLKRDVGLTILAMLVSMTTATASAGDTATEPVMLSPDLPHDVMVTPHKPVVTLDSLQHDFDRLSWETFVALNWPANIDGTRADSKIGDKKDNLALWELWKEDYEIFVAPGDKPKPWGMPRQAPEGCSEACRTQFNEQQEKRSTAGEPIVTVLEASIEPFDSGPLVDQNGRHARFEILVNKVMFDQIVSEDLYTKSGQAGQKKNVSFKCSNKDPSEGEVTFGAIMVKAAWKLLSQAEIDAGRFHTKDAFVYTRAGDVPIVKEHCEVATVGLVGLHIVHKTKTRPQWVWSTFEHVDNCPTQGSDTSKGYSFFTNGGRGLAVNAPPMPPWHPNRVEPPERRSRVVRMIPVTDDAEMLNDRFQKALGNSVWANYKLISTQWPANRAKGCDVKASAPVDVIGTPAPQFLGNSTLETYLPGQVPNASSSCMECHANATTTDGRFSDFTFLLLRAR